MQVKLAAAGPAGVAETVAVQNVSPHGVRVLTRKFYEPGERVVLDSRDGRRLARGRVVYTYAYGRRYAVGLELYLPAGAWPRPGRGAEPRDRK